MVGGGALAGATGLLSAGDRVPDAPKTARSPVARPTGFALASVRAADPDGGPAWGIGTYDAIPRTDDHRPPRALVPPFTRPVSDAERTALTENAKRCAALSSPSAP
jgi:hypothetical protein